MSAPATAGAASRPVTDVMRHGVVLCDADASARQVAQAMRDRGVRTVLVVDISSELLGLVDEGALVSAAAAPDRVTAAEVMDTEPLLADPSEPVGVVAQRMLAAGVTTALVAAPAPPEESGQWSEWKERGLPLGTLTVADIIGRLDELESYRRTGAGTAFRGAPARVRPLVALGAVLALVAILAVIVFALANARPTTTHPGCAIPTQGGC